MKSSPLLVQIGIRMILPPLVLLVCGINIAVSASAAAEHVNFVIVA